MTRQMKHNIKTFYCINIGAIILLILLICFNYFEKYATFTFDLSKNTTSLAIQSTHTKQQHPIGNTIDEHTRLWKLATLIANWSDNINDGIPTVPTLSADRHLLILSVAASRVRYGVTLTFILVFPHDIKEILQNKIPSDPMIPASLNLWCIFTDGSVTPTYSYDMKYGNERISLLDCPLSSFAANQLWTYNRTLRVYLASLFDAKRNTPIIKAFVTVPKRVPIPSNQSQYPLTLCTSPLHNKDAFLAQWIEFHRLVGFHKFVVYNTTDTNGRLSTLVNLYGAKHPALLDVVQWRFSHMNLKDPMSRRYFQTAALHDCLIRYGDQSEWLGAIDLDEYIVPLPPYETVLDYLIKNYGYEVMGSLDLRSQFYCTEKPKVFTSEESNITRPAIERFTLRARSRHKGGREKYLYRPRFVQYLSIHRQVIGLQKREPSEKDIVLAHYGSMERARFFPGCNTNEYVNDTSIRDRFKEKLENALKCLYV